jgi:hypothetical protein
MIHDDENVINLITENFIYSICAFNPLLGGNPIIHYNGLGLCPNGCHKEMGHMATIPPTIPPNNPISSCLDLINVLFFFNLIIFCLHV